MSSTIQDFEELFYDLHTGVVGDHERPHKPGMLLAVLDLVGSGLLKSNLIPFTPELRTRFSEYFTIVRSQDDQDTPWNPYFYLRSEPFWSHVATPGNEAVVAALSNPPTIGQIHKLIAGARLGENLWNLLRDEECRERLRDVLVSRYFPDHREKLSSLSGPSLRLEETPASYESSGRSAGFRRVVVQAYEHQCAACGLRIRLKDGATIVEAAHIIPFAESHNDHPRNGLALCRNHHWAMDAELIAPSPDHRWITSSSLDDRQPGEKALLLLADRALILPKETAYHPLPEALEWRLSRLA